MSLFIKMFKLIAKYILPTILSFIAKKVNLPDNIVDVLNKTLNTKINVQNLNEKDDRKTLLRALANAKSKQEADFIREILRKQDNKKSTAFKLFVWLGAIACIIAPFILDTSSRVRADEQFLKLLMGIVAFFIYWKTIIMGKLAKRFQCQYCYTTSYLNQFKILTAEEKQRRTNSTFSNYYVGSDNYANYYKSQQQVHTFSKFDVIAECPCCGFRQELKVYTRSTRTIR